MKAISRLPWQNWIQLRFCFCYIFPVVSGEKIQRLAEKAEDTNMLFTFSLLKLQYFARKANGEHLTIICLNTQCMTSFGEFCFQVYSYNFNAVTPNETWLNYNTLLLQHFSGPWISVVLQKSKCVHYKDSLMGYTNIHNPHRPYHDPK